MLILALDTSSRQCSLALLLDEAVIASIGGETEEPYASRVFTDLRRIAMQAGVELPQIELFAVATGPGSFTGLRVGLSAVKGWAEVFGRPVAAVSILEAIGAQAAGYAGLVAPIMDARGGHVFGGLFRREGAAGRLRKLGEEVVMSPAEYLEWVARQAGEEDPVFATTTLEVAQIALQGSRYAGARLESVSPELAPSIGRLGLLQSRRGDVVDARGLEANYVRRSDAEVKWKGG